MDQGLFETIQATACTSSLHGNHYMHSLTALNVLLAITASLGNALILVALRKESFNIFVGTKSYYMGLEGHWRMT